jgi:polyketide synthase PksJ
MNILKEYLHTIKNDFGIPALAVDCKKLTDKVMPENSTYGVPVLNKQGYVRTTDNEYSKAFIIEASNAKEPVLEIGCAYGHIVNEVLKVGGKITACDIGEDHLEILIRECPKEHLKNLHVYPARFPEAVDFPEETFHAVLASRVLHFLDGKTLEAGLDKIYKWLKPNGKFYFTALSIHKNYIKDDLLSQFQENFEKGIRWAGEIDNQHIYAMQHINNAPEFIHVFDIPQLEKIIPEFGFEIEKISLFDYSDDMKSNNKGHIGFIARKV